MERFLQITVTFVILLEVQGKELTNLIHVNGCPPNMYIFHPDEDNRKDWVCECFATQLYYSGDDSCYDAYRQGPCPPEHYLVVLPGETVAKCEKNPCLVDGFVFFQNNCHFLWRRGPPCESDSDYLGVDETTFELKCSGQKYNLKADNLVTSKSCAENMIFRPRSEDDNEYVCECRPGRFDYPANQSCLAVYRQGPCPPEHYIVISSGEPICEKNPCLQDGLVPWEGGCHKLGKTGPPCEDDRTALDVDDETYELQCIYTIIYPASQAAGGIINAPVKSCPAGSRRIATGTCKRVFQ